MGVEKLLDELDNMIQESTPLPLSSGKCVIDKDRVRELIQEIKENFPIEMHQAQSVVEERNNILERANKEAEDLMKRAETHAKKLISQEEIVRQAASRANEIVTLTQNRSNEIKRNTAEYANTVLASMEETLEKNLSQIRQSRKQLKTVVQKGRQPENAEGAQESEE